MFGEAKTNYAVFVECIMGNIHLKLFKFGSMVQEEMFFLRTFLENSNFRSAGHFVGGAERFE